jgi:holliday junction DNA helicase RuvA
MIGYLEGKVLSCDGKKLILKIISGVGYELNYGYFVKNDSQIAIYIHHHISENDESLWGFNTLEDKKMFELLKTVNKVGSSKAYPLITTIGTKNLLTAISFDQPDVLSKAPGIGKKMAEQIILSLKDKIEKFNVVNAPEGKFESATDYESLGGTNEQAVKIDRALFLETIQALESLGYRDKDVMSLVQKNYNDSIKSSQDLLKKVLREL